MAQVRDEDEYVAVILRLWESVKWAIVLGAECFIWGRA